MNGNGYKRRGCGCMKMARGCWNNFPYYTGPCADVDGCYERRQNDCREDCREDCCDERRCDRDRRCRCRRRGLCSGMFTACLPVAISANGVEQKYKIIINNNKEPELIGLRKTPGMSSVELFKPIFKNWSSPGRANPNTSGQYYD